MAFNNIIPIWMLLNRCRKCGKKVVDRKIKPGVDCVECGGDCELEEEEIDCGIGTI